MLTKAEPSTNDDQYPISFIAMTASAPVVILGTAACCCKLGKNVVDSECWRIMNFMGRLKITTNMTRILKLLMITNIMMMTMRHKHFGGIQHEFPTYLLSYHAQHTLDIYH